MRTWRRRQKLERARAAQDSAVVALLEGRYGRAQQRALEALAIPGSSGLNAIIGARAAIDVRNFDAAETMLNRPDAQATSLAVARLMLLAEIALEHGEPQRALDILRELRREAGMHTAALRLELRCLQAARRWTDVAPLLEQLVRRKVFDSTQAEHVRVTAQSEQLKALAHDAAGLREYWNRLPDAAKRHPKVARAAATSFLQLGGDREAIDILVESLERDWNSELVELYGECRPATRRDSSNRPSAGYCDTTRIQCCCAFSARCASAGNSGARRKPISRRASRWTTPGAPIWRSAKCSDNSIATKKRTRTLSRR